MNMLVKKFYKISASWWLRTENAGNSLYAGDVYFSGAAEIREKFLCSIHISPACIV